MRVRTMRSFSLSRFGLPVLLAVVVISAAGAAISNVEISEFEQAGLEMSFRVVWESEDMGTNGTTTGTDDDSPTNFVDMWLLSKQANPSSWIETVIKQVTPFIPTMSTS